MTCLYPFDDGPYVLGALSPAERAEYERHLAACSPCRESVAALAVLPGLLSRLDPATVAPQPITAPPTLLPRILALIASRRRAKRLRRRWLTIAACVVAVLLAGGVGVGVRAAEHTQPPVLLTAMRPVADNIQMDARVGLTRDTNGTWVSMQCVYNSRWGDNWTMQLVVYPRTAGQGELLASWSAESDQDWQMRKFTHLTPEQIGRIEIQRSDGWTLAIWMPTQ
jgi:hypothetical protein